MTRLLVVVLLAFARVSAADQSAATFQREIDVSGSGMVAAPLDGHVYEAARSDLGDLRLVDEQGKPVPYALDRGVSPPRPERRPRILNRGVVAGGAATAVLDFGERVAKESLALRLSGDNFRRRVAVEGSEDGRQWTTLTEDQWVFAVPGPEAARYEVLVLPENDFPRLRVTVHPGPRERERLSIEEAWLPGGPPRSRAEEERPARWSRADVQESQETWLTLDLGARNQPFHAVVLDVENERFFRELRVDVREEPVLSPAEPVAPKERWRAVGGGVVYRLEQGGELRERLRVSLAGRARVVRLRLKNRDDRPLRVRGVRVVAPRERLLFESAEGGEYVLTYGAPGLSAPTYDLVRTLGEDPDVVTVTLGPPIRRAVVADVLPWTERHPTLFWVGLLVVVAGLGGVTWRALRSA